MIPLSDLFFLRGVDILKLLVANKAQLWATKFENDAHWAPYWVVKIRWLPTQVLHKDERCTIYGNPLDQPPFLKEPKPEEVIPF